MQPFRILTLSGSLCVALPSFNPDLEGAASVDCAAMLADAGIVAALNEALEALQRHLSPARSIDNN